MSSANTAKDAMRNPQAEQGTSTLRKPEQHPWSSCHHYRRNNISTNRTQKQIYTLETRSISRGGNTEGRERPEGEEKNVPKLEVLAALQGELLLGLASSALETQDDLLGGLGLLVEDGLGLTTVTTLLSIVTTLTLGEQGGLEGREKNISALVLTDRGESFWLTLPALYWVTLCWVCLWHSLDLQ